MKTKVLFLISVVVSLSFGLNGYSPYKVYKQTDTLTHTNLDSNIVRPSTWSFQIADTIEKKFIRFSDIDDSSFTQMSIDTVDADTITAEKVTTERLTADSATIPVLKGAKTIRDTTTFTGGLRAERFYLNLTAGYLPYINASGRAVVSPIFTDGSNIAVENKHNILWEDVNAVAGSANAWNTNSSLKLITNYNQLGFFVSSGSNDRSAFIQVGHSLSGYANALGHLFLNPFGGNVSIGANKETPAYTLQVTGTAKITGSLDVPVVDADTIKAANLTVNKAITNPTFTGTTPLQAIVSGHSEGNHIGIDFKDIAKNSINPIARIAMVTTSSGSHLKIGTSNNWGNGVTNTGFDMDQNGVVSLVKLLLQNLTANRALIADASKNIVSSAVTSTELALLSGKNSVIDGSGTVGSIAEFAGTNRIGNGPTHTANTFQCSLFDNTTYRAVVTAKYTVFGNSGNYIRRVYIPQLIGTISSGQAIIRGLPNILRDNTETYRPVIVIFNNSKLEIGLLNILNIGNGVSIITGAGNGFSGVCGIPETSFTY